MPAIRRQGRRWGGFASKGQAPPSALRKTGRRLGHRPRRAQRRRQAYEPESSDEKSKVSKTITPA